jgi:hypothetical protein
LGLGWRLIARKIVSGRTITVVADMMLRRCAADTLFAIANPDQNL